jgi:hypothetical protein
MATVTNHKQLLIGKKLARTANTPGTTKATAAFMAAGEIFVVDMDGTILDNTAGAGGVNVYGDVNRRRLVMGQGATLPVITSAVIYKPGVKTYRGKAYTAATQQIDYIGSNGTTGTLDVVAGNTYIIRTRFKSNFYQFSDKLMVAMGSYTVKSTDTENEIAAGLTKNLIANVEKYVNKPYTVERVNTDVGTAIGAAGDTLVGAKGSKTLTFTGTGANAAITAGMYVRMGTAVTAPVYLVTASTVTLNIVGAATITLDIALETAVSLLGTTSEYITVALAAAGSFGIKLTGLAQTKYTTGVYRYEISKWNTTVQDAGVTTVTSPSTAPVEGSGVYEQIAQLEWELLGMEGFADNSYMQVPNITFRSNVELTGTYTIINLEWNDAPGTGIVNNVTASKQLDLAFNALAGNGTQYTGVVTSVQSVLNTWLPSFTALNL